MISELICSYDVRFCVVGARCGSEDDLARAGLVRQQIIDNRRVCCN
jgi:hypothetical protein